MGRGRKPLHMQQGNLTTVQKIEKEQAEQMVTVGREHLSKPPTWLVDSVAKKEFKRIVTELNAVNVVGNLDLGNLGGYCNAYSMYLKATKELKSAPLTVPKLMKDGSRAMVENPLINIQKKYAEEMRKFASLCGLTIDSRLKVATVKVHEENESIVNEFGDI